MFSVLGLSFIPDDESLQRSVSESLARRSTSVYGPILTRARATDAGTALDSDTSQSARTGNCANTYIYPRSCTCSDINTSAGAGIGPPCLLAPICPQDQDNGNSGLHPAYIVSAAPEVPTIEPKHDLQTPQVPHGDIWNFPSEAKSAAVPCMFCKQRTVKAGVHVTGGTTPGDRVCPMDPKEMIHCLKSGNRNLDTQYMQSALAGTGKDIGKAVGVARLEPEGGSSPDLGSQEMWYQECDNAEVPSLDMES